MITELILSSWSLWSSEAVESYSKEKAKCNIERDPRQGCPVLWHLSYTLKKSEGFGHDEVGEEGRHAMGRKNGAKVLKWESMGCQDEWELRIWREEEGLEGEGE